MLRKFLLSIILIQVFVHSGQMQQTNSPFSNPDEVRKFVKESLDSSFFPELKTQVAIVGAGVSGLYAANRLTTGENPLYKPNEVQVFEMDNRIGGRLFSVKVPGVSVMAELGGMRYTNFQKIISGLIEKKFKLDTEDFSADAPKEEFPYYLRGQLMHGTGWMNAQKQNEIFKTRYDLEDLEKGLAFSQLLGLLLYHILKEDPYFNAHYNITEKVTFPTQYDYNFSNINRSEWDNIKPNLIYNYEYSPITNKTSAYYGQKLNDISTWNLLKDFFSQEGYDFLADSGGYSDKITWNAAEALIYTVGLFRPEVHFKRVTHGYDLVAYKLAQEYLEGEGAKIWIENRLITFNTKNDSDFRYELEFLNLQTQQTWKVHANKIILAMPRRSLELLKQDNFFFSNSNLQLNLQSVNIDSSFKFFLAFRYPWWTPIGSEEPLSGHSITDLPMHQCYYFGADPSNHHSLLLATYTREVDFWQALAPKIPFTTSEDIFFPEPTNLVTNRDLDDFALENSLPPGEPTPPDPKEVKPFYPTTIMKNEIMAELREMFGPSLTEEPYWGFYMDWNIDPYGGGYHVWLNRYDIEHVIRFMRQPLEDESVFICGEAYSDIQGWVEGALTVTEKLLMEKFGLPRADFIDEDYYLGW